MASEDVANVKQIYIKAILKVFRLISMWWCIWNVLCKGRMQDRDDRESYRVHCWWMFRCWWIYMLLNVSVLFVCALQPHLVMCVCFFDWFPKITRKMENYQTFHFVKPYLGNSNYSSLRHVFSKWNNWRYLWPSTRRV